MTNFSLIFAADFQANPTDSGIHKIAPLKLFQYVVHTQFAGGSWRQKGDVIDMPRLMSAIHVVLVLGTCATAGSAAVVQPGLSKLYQLFFKS